MFEWATQKENISRRAKISLQNKLEGIRLMNELADKVLTNRQKMMRRKLRERNN